MDFQTHTFQTHIVSGHIPSGDPFNKETLSLTLFPSRLGALPRLRKHELLILSIGNDRSCSSRSCSSDRKVAPRVPRLSFAVFQYIPHPTSK